MQKNRIALLICSLVYCGNVFGMEDVDPFSVNEPYELIRMEGFWTTDVDLSWNSGYFRIPTAREHQREDWYQLTKYVAEPWCTITNLPFLYVAHTFMSQKPIASAALAFAGTASAVSHAIPKHWLNVADRSGAFGAVAGVIYDCNLYDPKTLMNVVTNPATVIPVVAMGFAKFVDRKLAHDEELIPQRGKYQMFIHCLWHLLAAYAAFAVLSYGTR